MQPPVQATPPPPAAGARGPISRRDLLRGAGAVGLAWGGGAGQAATPAPARAAARSPGAAILLTMAGGPSPRETFDPLPAAPARCRGPFGSIATAVPGVRVVEHLPEVARRLDRLALIRSTWHDADPTHEAGLRLLTTGRSEPGWPALGSRVARALGARNGMPPFVVLPDRAGAAGPAARLDDPATLLGPAFEPFVVGRPAGGVGPDPRLVLDRARRWADRAAARGLAPSPSTPDDRGAAAGRPGPRVDYGPSAFGRDCRLARRLVEAGTRLVVVNMAASAPGRPGWDGHGRAPFGTFDDYARDLLPAFDRGFAGLVDDLEARGLLGSTLVVAVGEFGRTPWINESGGRDHWPALGNALLAGGGIPGGRVVGASNPDGQVADRPVPLAELVAALGRALGLGPGADGPGPWEGSAGPLPELFG